MHHRFSFASLMSYDGLVILQYNTVTSLEYPVVSNVTVSGDHRV